MRRSLLIEIPGIKLRVEGERLIFFSSGEVNEIPLDEIADISVSRGVLLTSDLLAKLSSRGITVIVQGRDGPLSIVLPANYGGTAKTRREQIRAYDDGRGVYLAKMFVKATMTSRAAMLSRLARNRSGKVKLELISATDEIKNIMKELEGINGHLDKIRTELMNLEGRAAQIYFQALSLVIPEEYGYQGKRTRKPPRDPFNAAISYANGRVYSEAFRCVVLSGLDPFSGFLHADRPGRASMALDLAEEFIVPVSHRAVLSLFTKRQLKKGDFRWKGSAVYLGSRGRRLVLKRIEDVMSLSSNYMGRRFRIRDIMLGQARAIASYLRGERRFELANIEI